MQLLRTFTLGAGVLVLALTGLAAQVGGYLLAYAAPGADVTATDRIDPRHGAFPAGVVSLGLADGWPMPTSVWYPGLPLRTKQVGASQAVAMNMFGGVATAVGISEGRAIAGLSPDPAGAPYPLIVLSHGFAINPSSYGWLAEHLASHGFVVVAPHHFETLDPESLWKSTVNRPRDLTAILDHLSVPDSADGSLLDLIDMERVAVIGHSYGGYGAQAVGGARLDFSTMEAECGGSTNAGESILFLCDALLANLSSMKDLAEPGGGAIEAWPDWTDARVDAVVTMAGDAAMFGPAGLAALDLPVLAIGGTADQDSPHEWGTRYTFEHAASNRKLELTLEGEGHMVFLGRCAQARRVLKLLPLGICSSGEGLEAAHAAVSSFVTSFLLAELEVKPAALIDLLQQPLPSGFALRSDGY